MKRLLYAGLSAAALLLGTTVLVAAPASASTWTSGYCPTSKGVTVVVDFTAFHGGVETRCYPNASASTTGVSALENAGFNPTGTDAYGLAFICTIQSQPPDTHCVTTPPSTAYWSYWYAPNKGSWTYSSQGAASHHVIAGGFEGWSFHAGSGDASPPRSSTTRPVPVVKPTFHLGPAVSATAKHSTNKSTSSSSTSKATAKKTSTPTAPSTASATPGLVLATPDGTSTSSDPPQAAGKESPADPGGASPWPFLIGVVVVAAVGGGAWLMVYQRRQAGGS